MPIGLAVTVPAATLTGRLEWYEVVGALVVAGGVLAWSRWTFRRGIRSYSGASA